MSNVRQYFSLQEVCQQTGLSTETVYRYIEKEWISPQASPSSEFKNLDQEDLARIQFIVELQKDFGVNDEAIPLILHLLDQIHYLRNQIITHK